MPGCIYISLTLSMFHSNWLLFIDIHPHYLILVYFHSLLHFFILINFQIQFHSTSFTYSISLLNLGFFKWRSSQKIWKLRLLNILIRKGSKSLWLALRGHNAEMENVQLIQHLLNSKLQTFYLCYYNLLLLIFIHY